MSSSATSITSTPRRSRNCRTIRRTRRIARSSARAACCKCKATDKDDPTVDPRFGKVGKQTIEDTGALTKKRMETIDDETSAAAIDFMKRQHAAGKPFFCWFNATRMHLRTHVRAEHRGKYQHGDSEYIDGMIEHDETVGTLLKALDDLGIADNTIVVYSTDNGPHMNTWPDGAMTPFRSEKNTNWEGAFRVPCLVRWPGMIKPGTVTNELMSHNDWIPTLCADRRRAGHRRQAQARATRPTASTTKCISTATTSQQFLRAVEGTVGKNNGVKSARNKFFYSDDDGLLVGLRQGDYKYVFAEQRLPARWGCGPSRSRSCACRRSSTSSRIPTSGRTSPPTPTGTGS